jgi:hypothetical protein
MSSDPPEKSGSNVDLHEIIETIPGGIRPEMQVRPVPAGPAKAIKPDLHPLAVGFG